MKTWKITTHGGSVRTMKKNNHSEVIEKLEWEAGLVGKKYRDLEIFSIVLQD